MHSQADAFMQRKWHPTGYNAWGYAYLCVSLDPVAKLPTTPFFVLQELLTAALTHFQPFSQADSAARACLALAQLDQLATQPQAVLGLVQQ